jgi:hypothetical protein
MIPPVPAHVAGGGGHDLVLWVAAALVPALGAVFLAASILERRGILDGATRSVEFERWWAIIAAAWSLGAAAIHVAVIGDHLAVAVWKGVLFAIVATFQLGWAAAFVVRPSPRLALVAGVFNAGVVSAWTWSRLVGPPLAAAASGPEPIGAPDALATAFEIALIATLALGAVARNHAYRDRFRLPPVLAVVWTGSALVVAGVLGSFGVVQAASRDHQVGAGHGPSAAAGTITFGTRLLPDGNVEDPTATLPAADEVLWVAVFTSAPGGRSVELVVLSLDDEGRESERARERVSLARADTVSLTEVRDLAALGGGAGHYRVRYELAGKVLAQGDVMLTP